MAASDARPIPIKGVAYRLTFPIFDNDGDLVSGATALDTEVSKDGAAFADATNEATEIAATSGMYFLDLTATEMTADTVAVIVKTTSTNAKTTPIVLYPSRGDLGEAIVEGSVVDTTPAAGNFDGNTALSSTDDFYNKGALVFVSGTLRGLCLPIDDYVGSTRNLSFSPAFPVSPANGDRFLILGFVD